MTALPKKTFISPEEYLELERAAETKHEYFNGEIFAMAGASLEHTTIAGNIAASLNMQFKGRDCRSTQSDLRLHIPSTGLYTYPDIIAVCGKPLLVDDTYLDTLLNPELVVEVLSPSTANYDQGDKFSYYRTIETLKEYVLVWQDKKRVARYTKQSDGNWLLTDFIGDDATIKLSSVECTLSMEDIYDKVDFPA